MGRSKEEEGNVLLFNTFQFVEFEHDMKCYIYYVNCSVSIMLSYNKPLEKSCIVYLLCWSL